MSGECVSGGNVAELNTILVLCWSTGRLAASYYDIDQFELFAIQQAPERKPQYALTRNLIRQYSPLFCLVTGSREFIEAAPELLDLPEGTILQSFGSGRITPDERARICEFSSKAIKTSTAKILAMNLPGIPPQASESERRLFMESVLPFNQELLLHAVGCLLTLLDTLGSENDRLTVTKMQLLAPESQLVIDDLTYKALQIFNSRLHPSGFKRNLETNSCSLYNLFNHCSSKIGKTELNNFMRQPTRDLTELNLRFNTIEWCVNSRNSRWVDEIRTYISNLTQIQLLYKKISSKSKKNSDWKLLKKNIYYAYLLCKLCLAVKDHSCQGTPIAELAEFVSRPDNRLKQLLFTLDEILDHERGDQNNKFTVKPGLDPDLDAMRQKIDEAQESLLETSRLEMQNLPIDMDDVFVVFLPNYGFVFSAATSGDVENSSIFEQSSMTVVLQSDNTVYFQNNLCRSLNAKFGDLLAAVSDREQRILEKMVDYIDQLIPELIEIFKNAAKLDALLAFASVAESQGYSRPQICDEKVIRIQQGRHPLLEQYKSFLPNDTDLSSDRGCFVNILSSNESSGKTVYLKEVALICYMAHIGSFIPAESATIGLLDTIYTRLDYPESVFSGKSSFMGELYQMSNILSNTSPRSLVLIDEFGKGTTYSEGKSLLISSLEHLLQRDSLVPITIVATRFTHISDYLHGYRFLRVSMACANEPSEAGQSSDKDVSSIEHHEELATSSIQTMTLTLVKKYLSQHRHQILDPTLVVQLYKSIPITQPGSRRSGSSSRSHRERSPATLPTLMVSGESPPVLSGSEVTDEFSDK